MADETLDVETGDEKRAEEIQEAGKKRSQSRRSSRGDEAKKREATRSSGSKSDTDLKSRISNALSRIVEQLEARGDEELATAIRQDQEAMSRGLVSLTRNLTFLRNPLVVVLGFLEPVLAFWNVGRILGSRLIERRARYIEEREAYLQEQREAAEMAAAA